EMLPHIFEPFRQGKSPPRARGGLGIGLALVRHLVELHGGTIEATSEGEGHGATFTIRLPALRAAAGTGIGAPDKAGVVDPARLLEGLYVLVVDDDDDVRELAGIALREAGAEVTCVASAAEALRVLELRLPDVVVSDIGMPETSGIDLVQQLRASPRTADLPIVALTAYNRGEDREEAQRAGFDFHVGKPVEPLALVRTIATARSRRRGLVAVGGS
ncbi:MAG TPA: response regulator, partial [Burkholderiaceae bacterium]|nr:response regulator [Burkholderiaceae bacterium]